MITRIQDAMVLVAAISSNRREQNSFVFLSLPSSPLSAYTRILRRLKYVCTMRMQHFVALVFSPERALAYDEIRSGNLCKHEFCFKIQRARLTEL